MRHDVNEDNTALITTTPVTSTANVVFEDASASAANTTTVMLPAEAVYTSENGEFQHIEIITINGWP